MLIFDIETDGLFDTMSTLHCLSIYDGEKMTGYKQAECIDGVKRLKHALDTGK